MTSDVRVGLLFFIGLGLALWFTFFVTNLGHPAGQYAVHFSKVAQLKDGDPVAYNGVRVGTVAAVEPDLDERGAPVVTVSFAIDKDYRRKVLVDASTHYRISSGLLGGSFLDIVSTGGEPISRERVRGVMGETPVLVADAVNSVYTLIEENRKSINDAMLALRDGISEFGGASKEARTLLERNRDAITDGIANFRDLAARINAVVAENRETVKALIQHLDLTAQEIKGLVADNREQVKAAIDRLPDTVKSVNDAFARFSDMLADNREDVRAALQKLARIADNLDLISTQVAQGKGSLGKLVFQDTLHDHTVQTVDNVNQRLEEVKPFTAGIGQLKLYAGTYGGANVDTGAGVGGAYLRIEPKPWKYYLGGISYRTAPSDRHPFRDDPNRLNVDFNLELGWRFMPDDDWQDYRLTVAGGLIDSQLGGRAMVPLWGDSLTLQAMLRGKDNKRDPEDRRYEQGSLLARALIEYKPFARYGIYLDAGGDDLIDHPGPWFGLRAELLDNDLRNLTSATAIGGR